MRPIGAALLLALLAGPARAEDASIRVLLLDGVRSVSVQPEGGRERRVEAGRALRLPGPGPHQVEGAPTGAWSRSPRSRAAGCAS